VIVAVGDIEDSAGIDGEMRAGALNRAAGPRPSTLPLAPALPAMFTTAEKGTSMRRSVCPAAPLTKCAV
jgi:hypothetical protein